LNQKLDETHATHAKEIRDRDVRIQALEQKLSRLESLIQKLSATKEQP